VDIFSIVGVLLAGTAIVAGAVIPSAALPGSLLALALAVCVLSFTLRRGHRAHRAELARIFEQLDLLRFDTQQAATTRNPTHETGGSAAADSALLAAVMAREPQLVSGAGDYYAAAHVALSNASAHRGAVWRRPVAAGLSRC
jgi:hypothetical protein